MFCQSIDAWGIPVRPLLSSLCCSFFLCVALLRESRFCNYSCIGRCPRASLRENSARVGRIRWSGWIQRVAFRLTGHQRSRCSDAKRRVRIKHVLPTRPSFALSKYVIEQSQKMLRFILLAGITTLVSLQGYQAQQFEGDSCTLTNGAAGSCKVLEKCPVVYQQLLTGKSPDTLCGFSGYDPIICCPSSSSSTTTTRKPATTTSKTTTTTTTPIPKTSAPALENRRTGDLARQKCAEYASSVYALVEPPTLTVNQRLVNVSLCAIQSKKLIVGGTKAEPKEFPHMAAVGYNSKTRGVVWLCGGTLVSENFVVTAAHCTYSLEFGIAAWVRVGDLNLVANDDDAKPQQIRVAQRIRHPQYKKPAEYHDIALLRLERPVVFDAYARPACLPASRRVADSEAVATGWGRVDWTDDEGSNDLLKVTLSLVSHSKCSESFIGNTVDYKLQRGIIDDWQLCAGQEGKDTCQGDSGGPLVSFNDVHYCMYDIVGITSIGKLCGSIVPGVYTRVFNYVSWLESTIWQT